MVYAMLAMPTVPKRISQKTVSDLAPGECAYVAPSALMMMANQTCRIQMDIPVRRAPDPTASMQVTRTAAGFVADITYCHHQWTPTDPADCRAYAPVAHVVFGDEFLQ